VNRFMRASELVGHRVLTLAGESDLEIKDVVFDTASGTVCGFTLRHPGFLGKPAKDAGLPWAGVRGIGRDAVVVRDDDSLDESFGADSGNDVLGVHVLTDDGLELGEVTDVLLEIDGTHADVVGFELAPGEGLQGAGDHAYVPMPETISMSGEHVVVPSSAREHTTGDFAGFGAAVERFRSSQGGHS
jgi:sporulation protein YlmC with PRC-barrel domain